MPYIRHERLFTLQGIFGMEQNHCFETIFTTIDITPILNLVRKRNHAIVLLFKSNYSAIVYSLIARIIIRIPTAKDLVKRLRKDILFRMDCGFTLSEAVPSEVTYSRLIQKISHSNALEEIQVQLLKQAKIEGFVSDDKCYTHLSPRSGSSQARKSKTSK